MPAREKLNSAYFQGSLALAAFIGWSTASWAVFALALLALVVGNLLAGEIRPTGRGR